MNLCFVCSKTFERVELYFHHLKYDHLLHSTDTKKCVQDDCNKLFSSNSSLKRHLLNHSSSSGTMVKIKKLTDTSPCSVNEFNILPTLENDVTQNEVRENVNDLLMEKLKEKVFYFSTFLFAKNSLPRKDANAIINKFDEVLKSISQCLRNVCEPTPDLNKILNFCEEVFESHCSEYKYKKYLERENLFKSPISVPINNELTEVVKKGCRTLSTKLKTVEVMPIQYQIKRFFELPGVLEEIESHMKVLFQSKSITNFVNAETFRNHFENYSTDIIIPYNLFSDDFQINNCLGSHPYSICALYYSFPTLPVHVQSKLDFIFPAAFISAKFLKIYGNETCLKELINELKVLENGIFVKFKKVRFVLGLAVGDNLGLNSILGMTKSFNSSNFCRFCTENKASTAKGTTEQNARTIENYFEDVNNVNSFNGVREECVFNDLKYFHLVENISFDIMHDIFEGVCSYDISQVLLSLINENILNESTINNRKRLFPFGELESSSTSPDITLKNLKLSRIKMSASEMLCFVKYLPLMIGDLVPVENTFWKLIILLSKIIDIIMASYFNEEILKNLTYLIRRHHEIYKSLYGDLKPKHHFMVHYPTAIRKCGPLKQMWAMRYEAKHKEMKMYANSITSRLNPEKSIASKSAFKFSYMLTKYSNGLPNTFKETDFTSNVIANEYTTNTSIITDYKDLLTAYTVVYKNIKYKKGYFLAIIKEDVSKIFQISFFVLKNSEIFVACNKIQFTCFSAHFMSYELQSSKEEKIRLINIDEFTSKPMHIYFINNGKSYLRYSSL